MAFDLELDFVAILQRHDCQDAFIEGLVAGMVGENIDPRPLNGPDPMGATAMMAGHCLGTMQFIDKHPNLASRRMGVQSIRIGKRSS